MEKHHFDLMYPCNNFKILSLNTYAFKVSTIFPNRQNFKMRHVFNCANELFSGCPKSNKQPNNIMACTARVANKTGIMLVIVLALVLISVSNCNARPYIHNSRSSSGSVHILSPCGQKGTQLGIDRNSRSSSGSSSLLTNCL